MFRISILFNEYEIIYKPVFAIVYLGKGIIIGEIEMSSNETCNYCGSAVEADSEFCSNCGASLSVVESTSSVRIISESQPSYTVTQQSQTYQTAQPTTVYVPQKRDDSQGTIALIFGILACAGVLPCIGSIVAIIVGNQAKHSSNASLAVTLGWIGVCIQIVGIVVFAITFFWWY
jgi:hypothetical protein